MKFWKKSKDKETLLFVVTVLRNDDGTYDVNTDYFIEYIQAINFIKSVKSNFSDIFVECKLFLGKEIKNV